MGRKKQPIVDKPDKPSGSVGRARQILKTYKEINPTCQGAEPTTIVALLVDLRHFYDTIDGAWSELDYAAVKQYMEEKKVAGSEA